jgi:hypothetical protein
VAEELLPACQVVKVEVVVVVQVVEVVAVVVVVEEVLTRSPSTQRPQTGLLHQPLRV